MRDSVAMHLDAAPPAALPSDVAAARHELAARIPLDHAARAAAKAAAAHEALVSLRALEIARERVAADIRARVRVELPPPPPDVQIPFAQLPRGDA